MTKNFDWTENQFIPGAIINPGTGPVHNTSREEARKNIDILIQDVLSGREAEVTVEDNHREEAGRYTFTVYIGDRSTEIDMPGLPIEEVRFLADSDQDIFDFPRLYVDGSSWIWHIGVDVVRDRLFEEAEDE